MILIVDDDRQMRYILYHLLKNAGYNCLASGSAQDALAYAKSNPVDLVIADIVMPGGMDGVDLLRQIKKQTRADVILITAYTRDYPLQDMIDLGADDFIQKPVSGSELILRVKRVMKTRTLLEERNRAESEIRAKEAQLRLLARRTGDLEEDLRKRFAVELHDRIGQTLAALNLSLSLVKGVLPEKGHGKALKIIDDCLNLVTETASQARDIMSRLRPPGLDEFGLAEAVKSFVRRFVERTGIRVELDVDHYTRRLPVADEMILFRITQEVFTNIFKHAQADRVNLVLTEIPGGVWYTVSDNGKGFDPESLNQPEAQNRYGIATMRERIRIWDGEFNLVSKPGEGTTIEIHYYEKPNNQV